MRLARLPLLLAALLAPAFAASIAGAQAHDQKVPAAQTPSRAGEIKADDIIDRMSKAELAVLERLRTSHPLMEVYIQSVAPDEARGWVPTDDNYFLGQLQFNDGPALRPFGQEQREQRGVILRLISDRPSLADGFAAMVAPDWRGLERKRYEFTSSAGSSSANRAASSSTSGRFATARASSAGSGSRIATTTSSASTAPAADRKRRCQACSSGRCVPYGRLAGERRARRVGAVVRLLGRNGSEQRSDPQVVLQVEAASPVQEPDTDLGIPGE